jgi:ribosomal protein L11 methyltransferase
MAFGTGNHETTRLCLESMIKVCEIKTAKDLMDIGCGSGILSLSAKLLGIDKVRAIDSDPDSIKVSKENANDNSIGGDIEFKAQPVENLGNEEKFDLVVANIQADILIKNSTILIQLTKDKGTLVLSGILAKEINLVEKHFHKQLQEDGIAFSSQNSIKGEWSLLQLSL